MITESYRQFLIDLKNATSAGRIRWEMETLESFFAYNNEISLFLMKDFDEDLEEIYYIFRVVVHEKRHQFRVFKSESLGDFFLMENLFNEVSANAQAIGDELNSFFNEVG